jgi:hypothetical protein
VDGRRDEDRPEGAACCHTDHRVDVTFASGQSQYRVYTLKGYSHTDLALQQYISALYIEAQMCTYLMPQGTCIFDCVQYLSNCTPWFNLRVPLAKKTAVISLGTVVCPNGNLMCHVGIRISAVREKKRSRAV